jgi:DNA repair exonuclease SbcCD ATPase subunit
MFLLINLSLLEIAVLFAGAVILGLAIYFFIDSQRSLKQAILKTNEKITLRPGFYSPPPVPKPQKIVEPVQEPVKEIRRPFPAEPERPVAVKPKPLPKEESIETLKTTVLQQQKLLNSFLRQVEEIESEGREELEMQNKHLQNEIKTLAMQLEKKDAELEEVKQQASMSERMAARIEEVYQEFETLQSKMLTLEKQANRANNLALELEDARQAYEQVHKDLQRKAEKLEETFMENQRLQQQVNTIEDKLAEANLQRQQLQKKVQFLQDLNTDLQTVSDTNKKLQTELRRIGELESMLDMIAEERDYLLRKGTQK